MPSAMGAFFYWAKQPFADTFILLYLRTQNKQ